MLQRGRQIRVGQGLPDRHPRPLAQRVEIELRARFAARKAVRGAPDAAVKMLVHRKACGDSRILTHAARRRAASRVKPVSTAHRCPPGRSSSAGVGRGLALAGAAHGGRDGLGERIRSFLAQEPIDGGRDARHPHGEPTARNVCNLEPGPHAGAHLTRVSAADHYAAIKGAAREGSARCSQRSTFAIARAELALCILGPQRIEFSPGSFTPAPSCKLLGSRDAAVQSRH